MVKDEQPAIVFEDKDVGRVRLRPLHFFTDSAGDAFETGYPGRRTLHLDRHFRDIDSHESCVSKNLFPTRPNIFPAREPGPVRMNADRARICGPHFVHQVDVEAFESEVELEVGFHYLFGIGHTAEIIYHIIRLVRDL